MATLYFNAAVDNDWNTSGNWWLDDMFTSPGYVPGLSDDVYIAVSCTSNSGSTPTVNSLIISGSGVNFSISCDVIISCAVSNGANLSGNIIGRVIIDGGTAISCTLDDGVGDAGHLIMNGGSATSCIFNGDLIIGPNEGSFSDNFIEATTVNGDVIINDNSKIGNMSGTNTINGNVTINGTGYFASGTLITDVTGNVIVGSTVSSSSTINSVGGDLIYIYGNSASVSISSLSGGTYYTDYPTLYYNNQTSDNNWNNRLNWWADSGYTQQAYEVPSSSQDVVVNAGISSTTTDMYANNATISAGFFVNTPSVPTLNITSTITISDNYYIGDSMNPGPNIICVDAIFDGNSYITQNSNITASGTVTFNSTSELGNSSYGGGNITGNAIFNSSSEFVSGTITGNASFYDTSTFSGGTVTGDVTVYYPQPLPFSYGGTIYGSLLYSGYPSRTVYFYHTSSSEDWGGNFWYTESSGGGSSTTPPNPDISLDNVIIEASVGSNNLGLNATVATLTVNDVAYSSVWIGADITCDYANFNDSSFLAFGNVITQSANHGGNSITFSDLSQNDGTVNPDTPPVVFEDGSSNDGTINGDVDVYYPSEKPVGGTVTGFITYYGYTLYFGGSNGDWSDSNNWYLDNNLMIPYNGIPSEIMPYQDVFIVSNLTSNSSSSPSVNNLNTYGTYPYISNITILVDNLATFSQETYLDSATITGNALFENLATNRNGTITGTATFTLSSAEVMISNGYDGSYGDIEFQYGKGVNGSSILGIV